jgi:hypothetical protein
LHGERRSIWQKTGRASRVEKGVNESETAYETQRHKGTETQ